MSVNRDPQIGSVNHPNFAHQVRNELRDHAREINQLKLYSPSSVANSRDRGRALPAAGDYEGQPAWDYVNNRPCWWAGSAWVTVATVPV